MKKSLRLVLTSFCLLGCQTVTSSSVSLPASSSSLTPSPLTLAIASIKAGFDATAYIRESYLDSNGQVASNGQAQRVVLDSNKKEAVVKTLTYDATTGAKDNDSIPRYYHADEKGFLQERLLNEKNVIYDNDLTTGGIRYETSFYNPFEMLDEEDVTNNNDGTYALKEGFARQVASWFGYSFDHIQDRSLVKASLTLSGGSFQTFVLAYQSKQVSPLVRLIGEFHIAFSASGSAIALPALTPLSDDGTDKSALINAFQALGNNFTCTFTLKSGEMNLITSQKWKIYFAGESAYYDTDLYYSTPGLSTGDLYMTKAASSDAFLSVYSYDSPTTTFKKSSAQTTYDEERPSYTAISTNFFSKSQSEYVCQSGYETSVFAALEPSRARYNPYTYAADSCRISIDSARLPSIKETFLNASMGFGEEETVTVTYSDVGTTTIPKAVTSATLGQ